MENSVSQLKALVLECRRTMHTLKGVPLEAPSGKNVLITLHRAYY